MQTQSNGLKERLSKSSEIEIKVVGRKSGRTISIPVWFVADDNEIDLLPVQGSNTQWFKNVLENPSIRIKAGGAEGEFDAVPITEAKAVSSLAEKFRKKYGAADVKKYYSKLDVAVRVSIH